MDFEYIDRTNKISDDEIIMDLLYVKNVILKQQTITMKEYFTYGKYGKKAITNHFGSWNNLLAKLGIEQTRIQEHLSKEDIFKLIEDLWVQLGKQPTLQQFESTTHHTKKIIISNFGRWDTCLREFVAWEQNRNVITDTKTPEIKHKTPREPSKSMKYDVFKRDNFKCTICGKSPATDPSITLHVDHIIPYSLGGETVMSNLRTLCSDCNLGKSNKKD